MLHSPFAFAAHPFVPRARARGTSQVRNFPRLRLEPLGWRRVGANPKDGSLRFFATLPEGLDFGTLQVGFDTTLR